MNPTTRSEIRIICAWCGKLSGSKACAPPDAGKITHGICEPCKAGQEGGPGRFHRLTTKLKKILINLWEISTFLLALYCLFYLFGGGCTRVAQAPFKALLWLSQ